MFARPRYEILGNSHGNCGQNTRRFLYSFSGETIVAEKKLFSAFCTCSLGLYKDKRLPRRRLRIMCHTLEAAYKCQGVSLLPPPQSSQSGKIGEGAPEIMQKRAEHEPLRQENEGKLSKLLAVRACR